MTKQNKDGQDTTIACFNFLILTKMIDHVFVLFMYMENDSHWLYVAKCKQTNKVGVILFEITSFLFL